MAITLDSQLGATEAFATISEADAFLEHDANWALAEDEEKSYALTTGRYFIESEYECTITGAIPDELKYANSLLAADYIAAPASFETSQNLKLKRVKAGSVESETEYQGGGKQFPKTWLQVQSILQSICPKASGLVVYMTRA